ncbi:MAG: DUF4294 domain-containing protein [Flavobacteriales bacterium]|nr:DUF4294 domain-containing protein [Flavobacteriales bacterium]
MTIIQGRILVKLIDRQTGRTSYDLVKRLEAPSSLDVARRGQALRQRPPGRIRPEGDDRLVESIVHRIENGELATRPARAHREGHRPPRQAQRHGCTANYRGEHAGGVCELVVSCRFSVVRTGAAIVPPEFRASTREQGGVRVRG